MEPPKPKQSKTEFLQTIRAWVNGHCIENAGIYVCRECGRRILWTTCEVSIHTRSTLSRCSGAGKVRRVPLPFCPECEGPPKNTSTCIHVDGPESTTLALIQ